MLVKDKSKLVEAATGQKVPEPILYTETPMGKAMLQKVQPAGTYADYAASQGLYGTVPVTTMGLSPEGKYGGYYSKEDLQNAIIGEAQSRSLEGYGYAQTMRDLASKRYAQIGQTVSSQLPATRADVLYSADTFPTNDRRIAALQQFRARTIPQVQQMETTAQQIEETPVSQYARAIATRRYGMNPALAAGTFDTDLDVEMFEQRRNALSMAETGMPYDAARQAESDKQSALSQARTTYDYEKKLADEQMVSALEAATGLNPSRMRNLTGLSNALMYDTIIRAEGSTVAAKAAGVREALEAEINKYYSLETPQEKKDYLNNVYGSLNDPAFQGFNSMFLAMLLQREAMRGKTTSGLSSAALDQMMPIYDFTE